MLRIICEVRPKFAVMENVAALVNRGLSTVLGELAESGYDAEWQVLSAEAFGAPHLRERAFIIAYPFGLRELQQKRSKQNERRWVSDESEDVADSESAKRKFTRNSRAGRTGFANSCSNRTWLAPDTKSEGLQNRIPYTRNIEKAFTGIKSTDWWEIEPCVGRVAYGVPKRVDRLRCLGNAVVPQITEYIGRLLNDKL